MRRSLGCGDCGIIISHFGYWLFTDYVWTVGLLPLSDFLDSISYDLICVFLVLFSFSILSGFFSRYHLDFLLDGFEISRT